MHAANNIPTAQSRDEVLWLPGVTLDDGRLFLASDVPQLEEAASLKARELASMLAASGHGQGCPCLYGVNF